MSGEKFNLTLSDFDTSAIQTLGDLLVDTDFVDVTLASHDDAQIKAHKVVLSAGKKSCWKTYFWSLLSR